MRLTGGIAALAAASMSSAGSAQTASQAFECGLPYQAAMEAMASLAVKQQSSAPEGFLAGAKSTVEFEPGNAKVFGHAPARLSLELVEPLKEFANGDMTVSFRPFFARSDAVDAALRAAIGPMLNCETLVGYYCTGTPPILSTDGQLYFFRENERELLVVCRYTFNPADLEEI